MKTYLEEFMKDLKKIIAQNEFIQENSGDYLNDQYHGGVIVGIRLCMEELRKRLEET